MANAPLDPATGRRRAGRPSTLDVDRIAAAALAEIDGLSIAAVARRLGVSQGALYHHVQGRADLVRLAANEALRTWSSPDPKLGWRAYLQEISLALFTRLGQHPGLDEALLVVATPPPRLIVAIGEMVARLQAEGQDQVTASDTAIMLVRMAHNEARYLRLVGGGDGGDGDGGGVVGAGVVGGAADAERQLARRVDLILDGLEWRRRAPER